MFHHLIVGHINPCDPIHDRERPYIPKVSKPIPPEFVERALDDFGRDIEPYLDYDVTGFVICNWDQARDLEERVWAFADFLADREGAVVMDEHFIVSWPVSAREAQQEKASFANEHESEQTSSTDPTAS